MPICLLWLATLTVPCRVWLPDLDPNNLLYRPRGERGEGGGQAPIGANVAVVQAGARIDWGHLKGVVCTAKEQTRTIMFTSCREQRTWHSAC